MKRNDSFFRSVCNLAIPVALQSMLQSSFSIVDQIMIGQLGSVNVAGVGLAGKFAGIYSVVVAAFGAVAGIMISQYLGQKNRGEVKRSYYLNLLFALVLAGIPGGSGQYKVRKPVLVMLYKYRFRFLCRVTRLTFEIQNCRRYNGAILIWEGFL